MKQSADPALFHANPSADGELSVSYQGWETLSFYATKDGKITVSYQGWDQSKVVLDG